jgi:hypothetical protein
MSHPSFAEIVACAAREPHTDGMAREGRTRDGWYGEVPAEFPVTDADRAEWAGEAEESDGVDGVVGVVGADAHPYRTLPPRVELEDTVGEVDTSTPPFDPAGDPNREVANRWGAGMAGF